MATPGDPSGETSERAEDYSNEFYDRITTGACESARRVLQVVYGLILPEAVLDVGCGRGAWLAACRALGSTVLHGIDGPWLEQHDMLDEDISLLRWDLESTFPRLERRYGLAMSLEVAEHLSADRADDLVSFLCLAADVVLFSAAVPQQGGKHHVNEQWQSYWMAKFAAHGYCCHDVIRPALWCSRDVEWWYRQNTFLYVNAATKMIGRTNPTHATRPMIDIVHPENYLRARRLAGK